MYAAQFAVFGILDFLLHGGALLLNPARLLFRL